MRALRLILLLTLAFPASRSAAQHLTSRFATTPTQSGSTLTATKPPTAVGTQPPSATGAIVGGVLGAAAGTLGGAYLTVMTVCGGDIEGCSNDSDIIWTWGLSEALAASLGAHLGNRFAGSYPLDLLVAAGIATGGLALVSSTESAVVLIATPIVQLVALIAVERATGARRGAAAQPGG